MVVKEKGTSVRFDRASGNVIYFDTEMVLPDPGTSKRQMLLIPSIVFRESRTPGVSIKRHVRLAGSPKKGVRRR